MALSTYAANKMLDHLNGRALFAKPTAHLALFTGNPTAAGNGPETTYAGYSRLFTNQSDWAVAAGGASDSAVAFTFGVKTGGADVVLTHWATFDASVGGNMLEYGALTAPKTLQTGDALFIPAGSFDRTAT